MAEWLKGCEICNAGLCARFDELVGQGMSGRQAAKVLVDEQKEKLGGEVLYSTNALRHRLKRNIVGRNGPPPEKPPKPPPPEEEYMEGVYLAMIATSQPIPLVEPRSRPTKRVTLFSSYCEGLPSPAYPPADNRFEIFGGGSHPGGVRSAGFFLGQKPIE